MTRQKDPKVSVVMGCRNAEGTIGPTIESICGQTFVDWELIVVDDGSTDSTCAIIEKYQAADSRIRLKRVTHAGLTKALIVACQIAKGEFIARQDAGDRSLPERLGTQATYLTNNEGVVMVGCNSRFVGPFGEDLGVSSINKTPEAVTSDLQSKSVGLLHPAAMFRRTAYERVGGYRFEFRFAQDLDLWLRLSEVGLAAWLPEVLFEYEIGLSGISPENALVQRRLAVLAAKCYQERKSSGDDSHALSEAAKISNDASLISRTRKRHGQKNAYLIGSILYKSRDPKCRYYLAKATWSLKFFPKSILKWSLSYWRCKN